MVSSVSRTVLFKVLGHSSHIHGSNPAWGLMLPTPPVIGGSDGLRLFLFRIANLTE
jgi:hypothetical protein